MSRFPWLVLLALLLGFGVGLGYSWVIAPVHYVDTSPATLRSDFKDAFRTAIAAAYSATHNLDRARARLELLGDPNPIEELTAQAQRMLAAGAPFDAVQQVAGLASDLRTGAVSLAQVTPPTLTASAVPSGAPASSATATPQSPDDLAPTETEVSPAVLATATARPTPTPMPTAGAPFQLVSQDQVCNPNLTPGLMQVSVLDRHRHQMPGVEIDISWSGGEESFFTGLKPEIANGYADYLMQSGRTYALRVGQAEPPISGLSAPACPDSSGQTYTGGLKLVFQQP